MPLIKSTGTLNPESRILNPLSMKILLTEEQLRQGIRRMADEIAQHYQQKPLTIVGVMIGSIVLLADLIRLLNLPLRVELVQARSYRNGTRPGPLVINTDLLSENIRGRHVLLVDDIFDTGHTLWELIPQLDELGPESVRTAVLLRKQGRCEVEFKPHFVGFEIPDVFVVGYGLDYRDQYRNLPHVAVLEPQEMVEK
jgi:hypoxanthine phosphoribosyltransferase